MERTPCYKCNDRKIGCHGRCEAYIAWKERDQKRLAAQHAEREKDAMFFQRHAASMNAYLKGKKNGRFHQ